MAEMTQTQIEDQITLIDAAIAATLVTLGTAGQGGAALTDYKIGQIEVKGSQRLEQLQKAREMYQLLLEKIPYTTADVVTYDIGVDARDRSDLLGDE